MHWLRLSSTQKNDDADLTETISDATDRHAHEASAHPSAAATAQSGARPAVTVPGPADAAVVMQRSAFDDIDDIMNQLDASIAAISIVQNTPNSPARADVEDALALENGHIGDGLDLLEMSVGPEDGISQGFGNTMEDAHSGVGASATSASAATATSLADEAAQLERLTQFFGVPPASGASGEKSADVASAAVAHSLPDSALAALAVPTAPTAPASSTQMADSGARNDASSSMAASSVMESSSSDVGAGASEKRSLGGNIQVRLHVLCQKPFMFVELAVHISHNVRNSRLYYRYLLKYCTSHISEISPAVAAAKAEESAVKLFLLNA